MEERRRKLKEERKEYIKELDNINENLKPKKFVKYKDVTFNYVVDFTFELLFEDKESDLKIDDYAKNKEIVLLSMYNEPSSLYYAELTHEEYDEIEDDVIKCQDNLRLITIKYYLTKESFLRKICIKNPYNFVYIDTQEYSKEFYNELKKLFIDAKLQVTKLQLFPQFFIV